MKLEAKVPVSRLLPPPSTRTISTEKLPPRLPLETAARLSQRLRANDALEKLANLWLDHLLAGPGIARI